MVTIAKEIPKPDFMEQDQWNLLMKTRAPEIIKLGAGAHVKQYLEQDGAGDLFYTQGGPTLLLTTKGRKSGNEHITAANFMEDGDDVYVVGSIAGLVRHPHWALNLDAEPQCQVQVKARKWPGHAHRLLGDERAAVWPRLTEFFRLWGHFQKYCDREFMVFRISPRKE